MYGGKDIYVHICIYSIDDEVVGGKDIYIYTYMCTYVCIYIRGQARGGGGGLALWRRCDDE